MVRMRSCRNAVFVTESVIGHADIPFPEYPRSSDRLRIGAGICVAHNALAFHQFFARLNIIQINERGILREARNVEIVTLAVNAIDVPGNIADRAFEKPNADLLVTRTIVACLEHRVWTI